MLGVNLVVKATMLVKFSMLLLGFLVALQYQPTPFIFIPIIVVSGLSNGFLNFDEVRAVPVPMLEFSGFSNNVNAYEIQSGLEHPLQYFFGLCLGIGLLPMGVAGMLIDRQAFWIQIAMRILGSWITATGVLVLVLEWTLNK